MKDRLLPPSLEQPSSSPIPFEHKDELCERLDAFYKASEIPLDDTSPAQMFLGALYITRFEYRESNPDWIAQAAHSLREILYRFFKNGNKKERLQQYGIKYDHDVLLYYDLITDIAHHNFKKAGQNKLIGGTRQQPVEITSEIFDRIVFDFGKVLFSVLRRHIDAHKEIDEVLSQLVSSLDLVDVSNLLNLNFDTRQYFFTKADERWLDWLWENGFLDVIKEKSEDQTRYSYRMPELYYLAKVAETVPEKVVNIMLNVPISQETFNPEVVDQFLRICTTLSAEQLVPLVKKMHSEQWLLLMSKFEQWGYEYEKMLTTLFTAKEYECVLLLSEIVLSVRPKEEMKEGPFGTSTENPFYFRDVSETKVFEYLIQVDEQHKERAFSLVLEVMKKVVLLGGDTAQDEKAVFLVAETYHLFDVDFFTLELQDKRRISYKEDVRELAAVIKQLADHLFQARCGDARAIQELYATYTDPLPNSRAMWRLRLYILSLCPEALKERIKDALFFLFEVERFSDVVSGTEYKKLLKQTFGQLSEADRREYVQKVVEYFKRLDEEKETDKENWYIRYGSELLSSIPEDLLAQEDLKTIKEKGFTFDPNYTPTPSIGPITGGTIIARGPITQEEFGDMSISDIIENLKTIWTPEELRKQNTPEDFQRPLNAEGAGSMLREDILKRPQQYIENARFFFDRDGLDQEYTHAYLRGMQEYMKANRQELAFMELQPLVLLLIAIQESGEAEQFEMGRRERDTYDTWLAGWDSVHISMTDVLQELLQEDNESTCIDFTQYREQIFTVTSYLLKYTDPKPEDEEPGTAISTKTLPDSKETIISDPFTTAINSVRGRAFQVLVMFIYQDGKQLLSDVKKLYEQVLRNENTRALFFMFGHYLPSFYYRDADWVRGLLKDIFPQSEQKRHLYIAAWEGYLASNLFKEMFLDEKIQKYYRLGLGLSSDMDATREFHKDLEEGMGTHFALAFLHYSGFNFGDELFEEFWSKGSIGYHKEFIGFIGKAFISGDSSRIDELVKEDPGVVEKMQDLWDWVLENYEDRDVFEEFGFWMNLEKDIFNAEWLALRIRKTLEKTGGTLSWDYKLAKSIVQLAKAAPEDTLAICESYLLDGVIEQSKERGYLHLDNEWQEALGELYKKPETKDKVYKLVDSLIEKGGSKFWVYKEILKEENDDNE